MTFIILVQFPSFYYHNIHQRKQNINFSDIKLGFGKNMELFQSITTIIYAFECHSGLFPVLSNLQKPSRNRVQKVFKNAILIDVISCMIIALSGYLSQPFNTPELIIERHTIYKHDILMITGLILFVFTLITKVGANYNGFRITILNLFKYDTINYPNFFNIIITFTTLSITTFIAAYVKKNIAHYLNLAGTFSSIVVVIIIPGMIYIKGNDYPVYHYKNILTMIFIFVIATIGMISICCIIQNL
jgi:amino acid permease